MGIRPLPLSKTSSWQQPGIGLSRAKVDQTAPPPLNASEGKRDETRKSAEKT